MQCTTPTANSLSPIQMLPYPSLFCWGQNWTWSGMTRMGIKIAYVCVCVRGISCYFVIVFSSCELLKDRPMSPLRVLLLTALQAAWWLHTAKLCHLWLCLLARVPDCNLPCFSLLLQSSVSNLISLKNLSILCWNFSLLFSHSPGVIWALWYVRELKLRVRW